MSLALAMPAQGATSSPVEIVQTVYDRLDHSENLPGGLELWSDRIVGIWREMMARRAAQGLGAGDPHPGFLSPEPVADIRVELMEVTDGLAHVRGIYATERGSTTLIFELVQIDGRWRIDDMWREGSTAAEHRLSTLLRTMAEPPR